MLGTVLVWLVQVASTLYSGAVIAFAILLAVYPAGTGRPRKEVARVYRSVGPVTGLAMGAWVFGMVAGRFWETGEFTFAWDTPAAQLDIATWITFLALWFSSFRLEIWTMHDLRMSVDDDTGEIKDQAMFDAAFVATRTHIAVNAGLVVLWQTLRVLGA